MIYWYTYNIGIYYYVPLSQQHFGLRKKNDSLSRFFLEDSAVIVIPKTVIIIIFYRFNHPLQTHVFIAAKNRSA